VDDVDYPIEYSGLSENNIFNISGIGGSDPFQAFEPYKLDCSGIIVEICHQAFPRSESFCIVSLDKTFYLDGGKIGIKLRNGVEFCTVDILIWKIVKKVPVS